MPLPSATAVTPAVPRPRTPAPPEAYVTDPALVKRAVKAAALGNAMEWFDFGVYSYIAVTLGKVFFPLRQPHRAVAVHFRRLRRGLPRPPCSAAWSSAHSATASAARRSSPSP